MSITIQCFWLRAQSEFLETEHRQQLHELPHQGKLQRQGAKHTQQIAQKRELQQVQTEHVHAENEERLRFLREIQSLQVDLTKYLVAQYQHPDRLIRVDGLPNSQLHLHEQN